ncbi:3-deoxy-D-manno-octulosonic acid transferase [bacterium SCSIO 12741]|nr:3-deoxy-D-manno-octulosonic acid transferase [bacterium SCSIO 12741]
MEFLYSILVGSYGLFIRIASLFVPKARAWVEGRRNWRTVIGKEQNAFEDKPIWVHVSSVGEFEQGKPVIESLKERYPGKRIVLTFFSPSGYQLLSNYDQADQIYYLPLDGRRSAADFLDRVKPCLAIFVKYEFWYFYFKTLHQRSIPFVLISATLRPDQLFFKWYGSGYRRVLHFPNHYFVQDEQTQKLLLQIGKQEVTVCGDTRIDRVAEVTQENEPLPLIEKFKGEQPLLVVGSSWAKENELMVNWYKRQPDRNLKCIIAPHEINSSKIEELRKKLPIPSIRFTEIDEKRGEWQDAPILILDCIGILKRVYRYADFSVIGGGFIDGIHNILEPAAFGVPMMFGPNYHKFVEAVELIDRDGAFSFNQESEFINAMDAWSESAEIRSEKGKICLDFIRENQGATAKIIEVIGQKWNELD